MNEISKAGVLDRYIKSANIVTPSVDSLVPNQYERIKKLLSWHNPPAHSDKIDAIIVPTTSPNIDSVSFDKRIAAVVHFAQMYTEATMLFSGKRPDNSRATRLR